MEQKNETLELKLVGSFSEGQLYAKGNDRYLFQYSPEGFYQLKAQYQVKVTK